MKFPFYKLLDSMDCGPSCLRMIAKHYGKLYSLEYFRSRSYITNQGVSMLGISDAAESIGFRTRAYRITWEDLCNEVPFPCIVHWNQEHFVVVYDIESTKSISNKRPNCGREIINVADPASGLIKYRRNEFLKCWLSIQKKENEGTVLLLEPTPNFYRSKEEEGKNLKFAYLIDYVRPYKISVTTGPRYAYRQHY